MSQMGKNLIILGGVNNNGTFLSDLVRYDFSKYFSNFCFNDLCTEKNEFFQIEQEEGKGPGKVAYHTQCTVLEYKRMIDPNFDF